MNKTENDSVTALLARLERWLARHRRKFLKSLPPGASSADIDNLQHRLGLPLPAELRELLAWHNGQGDEFIGRFEQDWLLLCCQAIAATKNDLDQDSATGWNKAWIPFLDNDAGDFMFLDTSQPGNPVRHFVLGQTEPVLVAASLSDWLRDF